jgi:hypothetical protein
MRTGKKTVVADTSGVVKSTHFVFDQIMTAALVVLEDAADGASIGIRVQLTRTGDGVKFLAGAEASEELGMDALNRMYAACQDWPEEEARH